MSGTGNNGVTASSSLRKSVSMDSLSKTDHTDYVSDDGAHASDRNHERKPGTPWTKAVLKSDPDAEVIALSPKTLMATNRFICEICNKSFQREHNLQLHRRGHYQPWKTSKEVRKKVYVCPAADCVHHHPSRALADVTAIKKHFYRKHSEKKWKCERCLKKFAVQSDWKAHSKICGTREYRCDCGTLFSRRDSFIMHRAYCDSLAEDSAKNHPEPELKSPGAVHSHPLTPPLHCPPSVALASAPAISAGNSSESPQNNPLEVIIEEAPRTLGCNVSSSGLSHDHSNNSGLFASSTASPSLYEILHTRAPRPSSLSVNKDSPLSVNKDSYKIKKPLKHPASQPHPYQGLPYTAREPVLIYAVSPKVVHSTESDFMNVVKRLTGISPEVFLEPGSCKGVSQAARLAATENASLRGKKEPPRDETDELGASGMFSSARQTNPFPTYSPGYASVSNLDSSVFGPLDTFGAPWSLNNMQDAELSIGSPPIDPSAIFSKSYDSGLVTTRVGSPTSKHYNVVIRYRRGDISSEDFISHLRAALCRRGISVHDGDFDEVDTVPECRVLIIFLTTTCIPSNLLNIFEHQRKEPRVVYPIFYGISPSEMITNSKDEPKRWQAALQKLTQMPAYMLINKSESELIDEIVRDALKVIYFTDMKKMIGMDTQIKEILSLLCIESPEVRRIGIWGTVGIGKTAIAEEIFRIISVQYETCVFLKDLHKEVELKGSDAVREEILSKLLEVELDVVRTSNIKTNFLRSRLQRKSVLVILDNVNDFRDVETFLGNLSYFGPRSRIIITSRNRHVFVLCKIDHVYEVKPLDFSKSLPLLERGTFESVFSPEFFKTLSVELVKFSNGNPQVLQFLSRSNREWKRLSQEAQKPSHIYIPGMFERSCCGLDDNEKSIFLDIACFFRRMDKDKVAMLLDGCGFSSHIGFKNLVDKSLITILHNMVDMLPFLQATGREIVRQESADRPGDRSRLWDTEDIQIVFINDSGTSAIEGIFLDMSKLKYDATPNVLDKMCNLRLLKFYFSKVIENHGVSLPQGLEYLPSKLRLLHWEYYPVSSLPQSFDPKNLVELNLPNSCLKKLWKGKKSLERLKKMRLSCSYQLTKTPRLSGAPNLELLDLEGCSSLVSISQSICHLQKLFFLNLKDCLNLESVPSTVSLESLAVLNLSGCSKLEIFRRFHQMLKNYTSVGL